MTVTTDPDTATIDPSQPRTLWRFPRAHLSVRALMALVFLVAIGLGWYVRSVHIQQDAVAAIRAAGGSVEYCSTWLDYNPDIISSDGRFQAPRWLTRRVPLDYAADVVRVNLTPNGRSGVTRGPGQTIDALMAQVGRLRHLTELSLSRTAITDAGLAHLKRLTGLRHLSLDGTRVTDAGLAHLKGMTELSSLSIASERITDEGVLELERALPRAWINDEEDLLASYSRSRALDDLEFTRSRPIRQACQLLAHRAQIAVDRRDYPGFIETVDALCDLDASDKLSLIRLADADAGCLWLLRPKYTPRLDEAQRQALRQRLIERAMDALTRAVDLGYDNIRRLDGDDDEIRRFVTLRDHPPFRDLVRAMKAKHPAP